MSTTPSAIATVASNPVNGSVRAVDEPAVVGDVVAGAGLTVPLDPEETAPELLDPEELDPDPDEPEFDDPLELLPLFPLFPPSGSTYC